MVADGFVVGGRQFRQVIHAITMAFKRCAVGKGANHCDFRRIVVTLVHFIIPAEHGFKAQTLERFNDDISRGNQPFFGGDVLYFQQRHRVVVLRAEGIHVVCAVGVIDRIQRAKEVGCRQYAPVSSPAHGDIVVGILRIAGGYAHRDVFADVLVKVNPRREAAGAAFLDDALLVHVVHRRQVPGGFRAAGKRQVMLVQRAGAGHFFLPVRTGGIGDIVGRIRGLERLQPAGRSNIIFVNIQSITD